MTPSRQQLASISLDADNVWSYLKTHGDASWRDYPSYLDRLLPSAMDTLEALGLRCTFFIVGRDAADPRHKDALADLTRRAHSVGNHSYEHEPWLQRYSAVQLVDEIARAEDAIEGATGQRPIGFRGPGFSWTRTLLEVLAARGYAYDASTFPTFLGPLARAYYFWTARLNDEQREERQALFGGWRDVLHPIDAYRWRIAKDRTLLEIPVTTCPILRTPFHLSYLLYFAVRSEALALGYLRTALALCRATRVEPSILLHPLDFIGGDEEPRLAFFPAMRMCGARKRELASRFLREIASQFDVLPLDSYAHALAARPALRERAPNESPHLTARAPRANLHEQQMGNARVGS
ncbi:MAG: polysaccharide deacetylase family protein [Gemmatimonadaceae bacterium]